MKDLQINSLRSGGIITNYFCSSKCKHCLYGCSPLWKKEYISYQQAVDNFRTIKKLGCHSVHIGGGEPFLKINSLEQVLKAAEENNVSIEYIETNSSWYKDDFETVNILRNLKMHGLTTLLISMSPFHNEFIPLRKVKGVLNACRSAGLPGFLFFHGYRSFILSLTLWMKTQHTHWKNICRPMVKSILKKFHHVTGYILVVVPFRHLKRFFRFKSSVILHGRRSHAMNWQILLIFISTCSDITFQGYAADLLYRQQI